MQFLFQALAQEIDLRSSAINPIQTITSDKHHRFAKVRGQDDRNPSVFDDNVGILCHLGLEIRTLGGRNRDEILLEELLKISGALRPGTAQDIFITSDIEDSKRLLRPYASRLRNPIHSNK